MIDDFAEFERKSELLRVELKRIDRATHPVVVLAPNAETIGVMRDRLRAWMAGEARDRLGRWPVMVNVDAATGRCEVEGVAMWSLRDMLKDTRAVVLRERSAVECEDEAAYERASSLCSSDSLIASATGVEFQPGSLRIVVEGLSPTAVGFCLADVQGVRVEPLEPAMPQGQRWVGAGSIAGAQPP